MRGALAMPGADAGPLPYDQAVAVATERLGAAAWQAAWSVGRTLPLERAVAKALDDG